ncbi:hypothetical protein [Sphingomonas solaris]|uniref:ABC transporter n=1 Tax=Alterirhizorhabdus solaris TaxID=2529389 RepID=A0A558QYE7_9SPHN|nr:hypothetical protein [Sphingomonas solaris]TVV72150.1 hypothetical protein FOY91_15170 [Sphingomonas solaris]
MASGFALAELIAGLTLGQFVARDRAEVAIFLAFRPWLLLGLAAWLHDRPAGVRWATYGAALLAASAGEAILAASLGGTGVSADAARAVLGGLGLAMLIEVPFAVARRVESRFARLLGLVLGAGVLLLPGPLRVYEAIALRPPPAPVGGPRPAVMLLTGLPILWGEGGVAGALASSPSLGARRLADEFRLIPIDVATPATLAQAPLLLAAQPRALAPAETAAIDRWVRMGGRAVVLADPDLRWPSDLPPGDPRRPPREMALGPLLAGWGMSIGRGRGGLATIDVATGGGGMRRIVSDAPGIVRSGPGCRAIAGGHGATCRIGRGQAVVLADADLLDDRLWVGMGADGASRLARGGDNVLLVADWLDRLAGAPSRRAADSVSWARPGGLPWVYVGAALPGLALALSGLGVALIHSSHRRRGTKGDPHGYPQERKVK